MAKKKTLGRGLEALLGNSFATATAAEPSNESNEGPAVKAIPLDAQITKLAVDLVQRGQYQPRTDMNPEKLEELASSIRTQGVVQPIVVRPISKDRYEIIAGERRWRASQLAGLHEVPAIIREIPDQAAMAISLIENIQRENLNPLEEAMGLQRLIKEFGMTHQIMAEAVGKSRSGVSNLMRILELNSDVKRLLENGDLELGHAKVLLTLKGGTQSEAAKLVVAKDLSVRETENLVKGYNHPKVAKGK
ncbi:MAG: ParB/RepB/Spo0J family partition protein, partial [Methylococcales bacterium]|nr:ParB/RepB/Spo0J family partition protein [Methylococcales bacterium]